MWRRLVGHASQQLQVWLQQLSQLHFIDRLSMKRLARLLLTRTGAATFPLSQVALLLTYTLSPLSKFAQAALNAVEDKRTCYHTALDCCDLPSQLHVISTTIPKTPITLHRREHLPRATFLPR